MYSPTPNPRPSFSPLQSLCLDTVELFLRPASAIKPVCPTVTRRIQPNEGAFQDVSTRDASPSFGCSITRDDAGGVQFSKGNYTQETESQSFVKQTPIAITTAADEAAFDQHMYIAASSHARSSPQKHDAHAVPRAPVNVIALTPGLSSIRMEGERERGQGQCGELRRVPRLGISGQTISEWKVSEWNALTCHENPIMMGHSTTEGASDSIGSDEVSANICASRILSAGIRDASWGTKGVLNEFARMSVGLSPPHYDGTFEASGHSCRDFSGIRGYGWKRRHVGAAKRGASGSVSAIGRHSSRSTLGGMGSGEWVAWGPKGQASKRDDRGGGEAGIGSLLQLHGETCAFTERLKWQPRSGQLDQAAEGSLIHDIHPRFNHTHDPFVLAYASAATARQAVDSDSMANLARVCLSDGGIDCKPDSDSGSVLSTCSPCVAELLSRRKVDVFAKNGASDASFRAIHGDSGGEDVKRNVQVGMKYGKGGSVGGGDGGAPKGCTNVVKCVASTPTGPRVIYRGGSIASSISELDGGIQRETAKDTVPEREPERAWHSETPGVKAQGCAIYVYTHTYICICIYICIYISYIYL